MVAISEPPSQRLFFALWPSAEVADQILERAGALDLSGRAVPRDKLHVTLAFHGCCDAEHCKRLITTAEAVAESAFDLVFDRLGYFRRPGIAWFGLSSVPTPLTRLVDPLAADRDDRGAFVPHVSVARRSDPVPDCAIEPIVWHAREFALVESGIDGAAGVYRTLARWPLIGAGTGSRKV